MPIPQPQLFLEDNLIAVPVCQAGTFFLSGQQVHTVYRQFLPLMKRR